MAFNPINTVTSPSPTPQTSVTIERDNVAIGVGEKYQLVYTVNPSDETVVFESNSDAVTVSQTGEITANNIGEATITATVGNASDTVFVTVS